LAQRLGLSRAAVWARIEDLRRLGYDITASPHGGYRLVGAPDLLHADDLQARLGATTGIGRDIRVFRETVSTNDVADKLGRDGVREGAVVFAETQTGGRGRLGRKWVSPAGKGLWFSVLLRPPWGPQDSTRLTLLGVTAVARALREATGCVAEVKWPNDLLLRGRKVAGILLELLAETDRIRHAVLGIGVDVNLVAEDFPAEIRRQATSLRLELGRAVDRAGLAVAVLRELDRDYRRALAGQFEAVAAEWESLCSTLGQYVAIRMGDRTVEGRAEAVDAGGALLVRTEFGRLERVSGGDVTLRSR
jgi:BirA family biotin operon repressor/biotin-[acetyl-CoA-carboxylase] ligase